MFFPHLGAVLPGQIFKEDLEKGVDLHIIGHLVILCNQIPVDDRRISFYLLDRAFAQDGQSVQIQGACLCLARNLQLKGSAGFVHDQGVGFGVRRERDEVHGLCQLEPFRAEIPPRQLDLGNLKVSRQEPLTEHGPMKVGLGYDRQKPVQLDHVIVVVKQDAPLQIEGVGGHVAFVEGYTFTAGDSVVPAIGETHENLQALLFQAGEDFPQRGVAADDLIQVQIIGRPEEQTVLFSPLLHKGNVKVAAVVGDHVVHAVQDSYGLCQQLPFVVRAVGKQLDHLNLIRRLAAVKAQDARQDHLAVGRRQAGGLDIEDGKGPAAEILIHEPGREGLYL